MHADEGAEPQLPVEAQIEINGNDPSGIPVAGGMGVEQGIELGTPDPLLAADLPLPQDIRSQDKAEEQDQERDSGDEVPATRLGETDHSTKTGSKCTHWLGNGRAAAAMPTPDRAALIQGRMSLDAPTLKHMARIGRTGARLRLS